MKTLGRFSMFAAVAAAVVLLPLALFAQVSPDNLPVEDAIKQMMSLMTSTQLKGLGLVVVVIQGLTLFFRTSFASFAGKWKFTIVCGLSMVLGVITLMYQGMPLVPALLHSTTFAAMQVFAQQTYKQFTEKPEVAAAKKDAVAALKA